MDIQLVASFAAAVGTTVGGAVAGYRAGRAKAAPTSGPRSRSIPPMDQRGYPMARSRSELGGYVPVATREDVGDLRADLELLRAAFRILERGLLERDRALRDEIVSLRSDLLGRHAVVPVDLEE